MPWRSGGTDAGGGGAVLGARDWVRGTGCCWGGGEGGELGAEERELGAVEDRGTGCVEGPGAVKREPSAVGRPSAVEGTGREAAAQQSELHFKDCCSLRAQKKKSFRSVVSSGKESRRMNRSSPSRRGGALRQRERAWKESARRLWKLWSLCVVGWWEGSWREEQGLLEPGVRAPLPSADSAQVVNIHSLALLLTGQAKRF